MRIIVDAFGGDNAPLEIIKGCQMAVEEYGVDITLTGDKNIIKKTAIENCISLNKIKIVHTDVVISPDDDASSVVKEKKNSSMGLGFQLLAEGEGDAFVSAGNSGALVMGSSLIIKRIKGVKRPAFAPIMPKAEGCFMLVDGGANNEVRPEMLQQFAIMGSIYMNKVMGIDNPRVGLANVGTEEHKGGPLQQETYELLKKTPLNFIGNVEGRDIPGNACEVLVTDGFNGNLILKTYEGVAMELMGKIKDIFKKNIKNKVAAAMIMSDLKILAKEMDYNEYGGAAIMGINKPVFKAHGSSKAKTIKNAIKLTKQFVEGNVVEEISRNIANL
ncbi:MAG: phosphate acyltransferase PlsX [Acutalibacteraceae bacterium]|nr:phosphate acyltransferase PlsX [Acutalibacteraceae bacterium]